MFASPVKTCDVTSRDELDAARGIHTMPLPRLTHGALGYSTPNLYRVCPDHSAVQKRSKKQNIGLSAMRKTERMSRCVAAAKMSVTAAKALFFQNLSLFIVDQLFLGVSVGLRER